MWCKHSHSAVRSLLKAFVGGHAQGHLANLTAETTFVPVLQRQGVNISVLTLAQSSCLNLTLFAFFLNIIKCSGRVGKYRFAARLLLPSLH